MRIIPENKKGGVVTSVVMGVGGLIIAVIVILVIVSTMKNANLVGNDEVSTLTITNESVNLPANNAVQTLGANSIAYASCGTPTYIANNTKVGAKLTNGNFTISGCTITNASALNSVIGNGSIWVTYPYTTTNTYSKDAMTNLSSNFTSGINNISSKIPTILLIVAVVFLFGALVLLIRNAQAMGIFSGGGSGQGSL